jgi:DNA-binding HxlR family transcriptional regulator
VPKDYHQSCPVAKSLEFLGERWTLLIVRDLFTGPKKFHDLLNSLAGVAPGVLSHRLKLLEEHDIIKRRLYTEHPPRAEYALRERGLDLRPVIRALAVWGSKHLHPELALVHDRCETAIEMAYYCPSCNELIAANAARYRSIREPVTVARVDAAISASATRRSTSGRHKPLRGSRSRPRRALRPPRPAR